MSHLRNVQGSSSEPVALDPGMIGSERVDKIVNKMDDLNEESSTHLKITGNILYVP